MPAPTPATVLVGMSVDDVDARDVIRGRAGEAGASVAFLQMAEPSLSAELTRLADLGHSPITLIGIDQGPLGPGRSWLARIAAHWWRERSGRRPEILVATRLATDLADLPEETRPLTTDEPGLTSQAWEHVGGHRHQVMVCRGPRCTAQGAFENVRAMLLTMMEHGVGDDDVLLVHTGCQSPCNQAPVLNVQPDDVWYGRVGPDAAAAIVREHLLAGRPVAEHRLPRRRTDDEDGTTLP